MNANLMITWLDMKRYFITFIVDYLDYTLVYLMRNKSGVCLLRSKFLKLKINSIRKSSDLIVIEAQNNFHISMSFYKWHKIIHETIASYSLDMNGKAVIKNILFTGSVVVIMLNSSGASHCWENFINYLICAK